VFIYKSSEDLEVLKDIKNRFGIVPPHWALLANLHPKKFEMFMQEIEYFITHKSINPDLFGMIRLHVAHREGFSYCISFNTKLLLAKGYLKDEIKALVKDIKMLPLDDRHKLLAKVAVDAIYKPEGFTREKIATLKELSWSDTDIYDAVDHAAFLFKFARIIKAYLS
jgi:hypothetical protein